MKTNETHEEPGAQVDDEKMTFDEWSERLKGVKLREKALDYARNPTSSAEKTIQEAKRYLEFLKEGV